MKNINAWKPTKYELHNGHLKASRDPNEVGVGSRLFADMTAQFYDEFLPKYARGKLLDLGCGFAPLYLMYKEYADDVVLVDWGNSSHKNECLDLECDLNGRLPFADGLFDTIILSDVLEHIYEPKLLLSEISRILSKDGVLLLNVPFYYWLHETPHDYFRYTYYALSRMINEADMKLSYFEGLGGAREVIVDIFCKRLLSKDQTKAQIAIADFLQSYCIKHKNKTLSRRQFPLGYVLAAIKQGDDE